MAEQAKEKKVETKLLREMQFPSAVLGLAVSQDGQTFYAACMDGGVYVAGSEKEPPQRIGKHDSYCSSIHLLPDGETLVSGGYDGTLLWHDLRKRQTVRTVKAHRFWSWQTDLSPNGDWLASVT